MFGQQFVGSLDRLLRIVVQVAWLNFLWIIFTLLGLVVAGFFPATSATISVARKWVQKKEEKSVLKAFKKSYKQDFIKSNVIGLILTVMGVVLFINYKVLVQLGNQLPIIVVFAFYLVIFLYTVLVIWIFPLFSHYQSNVIQYFKNAMIIGITKIPTTIFIGLSIFVILYLSLKLPTMLLFCTVSLIGLAVAFFSLRVFETIDNSENLKNDHR